MELRGGLERFHVSPVPCEFEIQLEGSLQSVEARIIARHGPHCWPVVPEGGQTSGKASPFPLQG
jgi:hypothetical protein